MLLRMVMDNETYDVVGENGDKMVPIFHNFYFNDNDLDADVITWRKACRCKSQVLCIRRWYNHENTRGRRSDCCDVDKNENVMMMMSHHWWQRPSPCLSLGLSSCSQDNSSPYSQPWKDAECLKSQKWHKIEHSWWFFRDLLWLQFLSRNGWSKFHLVMFSSLHLVSILLTHSAQTGGMARQA